jgi:hypothetical protein
MISHAANANSQRPHDLLSAIDHPQPLRRHFLPVSDATRKAGRCRLIRHGQIPGSRERPNLCLRNPAFGKRASHAMLRRRRQPRPIVAQIISVRAAGDYRHTQPFRQSFQTRVKLRLAMKAAVRRIGRIRRVRQLMQFNPLVPNACSSSPSAKLSLNPVTAIASSPSASCAAFATTALSTPPEYATAQLP